MMTIAAIGAPITEAERAAIPASTREDPNNSIPIEFPRYVKIPPTDAPRTKAGEKTPPKKPMLRHVTVTNNFSIKIRIIKFIEYFSFKTPLIVSPPSPSISGINPPSNPHISTAIRILTISLEEIFVTFFCKFNKLFMKITAIRAHTGPNNKDKETAGNKAMSESVF